MATFANLNRLVDVVDELRTVHPDMTLNQLQVLLLVSTRPGISQSEIMELAGLADSSASRIISILSAYGNRGTGPFHLVEMRLHPHDRRLKALYLTKKGEAFMEKIEAALMGRNR